MQANDTNSAQRKLRSLFDELTAPLYNTPTPFQYVKSKVTYAEPTGSHFSHRSFLERIKSFKEENWLDYPNDALYLAKYGWKSLTGTDVSCVACHATMHCSCFIGKSLVVMLMSKEGHRNTCSWSLVPFPDVFFKIPRSPQQIQNTTKVIMCDLLTFNKNLPLITQKVIKNMKLDEQLMKSALTVLESECNEVHKTALILAVCGWVKKNKNYWLTCKFCNKSIWLCNFYSIENEESSVNFGVDTACSIEPNVEFNMYDHEMILDTGNNVTWHLSREGNFKTCINENESRIDTLYNEVNKTCATGADIYTRKVETKYLDNRLSKNIIKDERKDTLCNELHAMQNANESEVRNTQNTQKEETQICHSDKRSKHTISSDNCISNLVVGNKIKDESVSLSELLSFLSNFGFSRQEFTVYEILQEPIENLTCTFPGLLRDSDATIVQLRNNCAYSIQQSNCIIEGELKEALYVEEIITNSRPEVYTVAQIKKDYYRADESIGNMCNRNKTNINQRLNDLNDSKLCNNVHSFVSSVTGTFSEIQTVAQETWSSHSDCFHNLQNLTKLDKNSKMTDQYPHNTEYTKSLVISQVTSNDASGKDIIYNGTEIDMSICSGSISCSDKSSDAHAPPYDSRYSSSYENGILIDSSHDHDTEVNFKRKCKDDEDESSIDRCSRNLVEENLPSHRFLAHKKTYIKEGRTTSATAPRKFPEKNSTVNIIKQGKDSSDLSATGKGLSESFCHESTKIRKRSMSAKGTKHESREKKIKSDISKRNFHPEEAHHFWCIWRVKSLDCKYPDSAPMKGWQCVFEKLKTIGVLRDKKE